MSRLARLEHAGTSRNCSYVVPLPAEAMTDAEAVRAAIEEHRRYGGVVAAPTEMTVDEWVTPS